MISLSDSFASRQGCEGRSAAKPLPLLHPMEERVGGRRRVFIGTPLSSVLSPLLRRGERKHNARWKIFAAQANVDPLRRGEFEGEIVYDGGGLCLRWQFFK